MQSVSKSDISRDTKFEFCILKAPYESNGIQYNYRQLGEDVVLVSQNHPTYSYPTELVGKVPNESITTCLQFEKYFHVMRNGFPSNLDRASSSFSIRENYFLMPNAKKQILVMEKDGTFSEGVVGWIKEITDRDGRLGIAKYYPKYLRIPKDPQDISRTSISMFAQSTEWYANKVEIRVAFSPQTKEEPDFDKIWMHYEVCDLDFLAYVYLDENGNGIIPNRERS